MQTSIRFYLKGKEFNSNLISEGASCNRRVTEGYIQFSSEDGFLVLQPETFLSKELLSELDRLSTKVTLLASGISLEQMIKPFNPRREFHLEIGDLKVSGLNWGIGSYKLLFCSTSSEKVFGAFRSFVPGLFLEKFSEVFSVLAGMTFFQRVRLVFSL